MKRLVAVAFLALCMGCAKKSENSVRFGHFPNVTHVQALVAQNLSRHGKGWFEERLGPGIKVEWYLYNAGPSAMEAIFADSIDVTYVGPSPAINAYAKSNGSEVRIVAGAVNGGAALLVQPDSTIKTGADFRGKRIATPQLGNTQDVSCRAWLKEQGLNITQLGGDAQVLPTANPDQLSLFLTRKIDAAWTVEPWVSRLVLKAGAKVFLEEKDSVTTVLVSSTKFAAEKKALLEKIVQANKELTEWIKSHPQEAQKMVVEELSEETKSAISPELVAAAWPRILLTSEVDVNGLKKFVNNAKEAGFLNSIPDLSRLVLAP